ncbi:hypothetical protein [Candidatus Electronema sp. JC]
MFAEERARLIEDELALLPEMAYHAAISAAIFSECEGNLSPDNQL